ncbi:MAG: ABC transporter permease [Comamonadaceae bacterium]|nr:ABC transporter permease [Comamonadaceae bacterium]
MPKFVLLWTDAVMWALAAALVAYLLYVLRSPARSANWRRVFRDPAALGSSVLLVLCLGVTLADSVHYRTLLPPAPGAPDAAPAYDVRTRSLLDHALRRLVDAREETYSRPLAYLGFTKESVLVAGEVRRQAPRLKFGGAHLRNPEAEWAGDLLRRGALGLLGGLATVATLPLAVVLGIMAGYFKGWVDELIQYVYTVLSSVPNVLLIAACVLMVQVFIDQHADLFQTGAERSDLKLFLLCAVLGLTGWAGLCRLLRGETLKLRELEYVQAASAFGVGHARIMLRHIFPNVAHLMLIVTVLDFSALILYEAVLSYVGVGVDPSMNSFGGMINLARNEMSRDPIVWWSFAAAFGFMVTLVLAANLFADGVRDAFDPHAGGARPRRAASAPRT